MPVNFNPQGSPIKRSTKVASRRESNSRQPISPDQASDLLGAMTQHLDGKMAETTIDQLVLPKTLPDNSQSSQCNELGIMDQLRSLSSNQETSTDSIKSCIEGVQSFLNDGVFPDEELLKDFPEIKQTLTHYNTLLDYTSTHSKSSTMTGDARIRLLQMFEKGVLTQSSSTEQFLNVAGDSLNDIVTGNKDPERMMNSLSKNQEQTNWRTGYDTLLKVTLDSSSNTSEALAKHCAGLLSFNSPSPTINRAKQILKDTPLSQNTLQALISAPVGDPQTILVSVLQDVGKAVTQPTKKQTIANVLTATTTTQAISTKNKTLDGLHKKLNKDKNQELVRNNIIETTARMGRTRDISSSVFADLLLKEAGTANIELASGLTRDGETELNSIDNALTALIAEDSQDLSELHTHISTKKNALKDLENVLLIGSSKKSDAVILDLSDLFKNDQSVEDQTNHAIGMLKTYICKNNRPNEERKNKLQTTINHTKPPLKELATDLLNRALDDLTDVRGILSQSIDNQDISRLDGQHLMNSVRDDVTRTFFSEDPPRIFSEIELDSIVQMPKKEDLEEIRSINQVSDPTLKQQRIKDFNLKHASRRVRASKSMGRSSIALFNRIGFTKTANRISNTSIVSVKPAFEMMNAKIDNTAALLGMERSLLETKCTTNSLPKETMKAFKNVVKHRKRLLKTAGRDIRDGVNSHRKRDAFVHGTVMRNTDALYLTKQQLKGVRKARVLIAGVINRKMVESPDKSVVQILNELSKNVHLARTNPAKLDQVEPNETVRDVCKYFAQAPGQVQTYFDASIADLGQSSQSNSLSKKESRRSVNKTLLSWKKVASTKTEKKSNSQAIRKAQARLDETELAVVNRDFYTTYFSQLDQGKSIQIDFKNIMGLSTAALKPAVTILSEGAITKAEFGIAKTTTRGIGFSYNTESNKYEMTLSQSMDRALKIKLGSDILEAKANISTGSGSSLTYSFNHDELMSIAPKLLQAEITPQELDQGLHQADFGQSRTRSMELGVELFAVKWPDTLSSEMGELVGHKSETESLMEKLKNGLDNWTDETGATLESIQESKQSIQTAILTIEQQLETLQSNIDRLNQSPQSDANNTEIKAIRNTIKDLNNDYIALKQDLSTLASRVLLGQEKPPPTVHDLANHLKSGLDLSEGLKFGVSISSSRESERVIQSGGLTQINSVEYSGSFEISAVVGKKKANYSFKENVERQRRSDGKKGPLVNKTIEQSYVYNRYSPINHDVHDKLKRYQHLPICALPITVKHGLPPDKIIQMQKLNTEKEKQAFFKANSEIIEISTEYQVRDTQTDASTSMVEYSTRQVFDFVGLKNINSVDNQITQKVVLFEYEPPPQPVMV